MRSKRIIIALMLILSLLFTGCSYRNSDNDSRYNIWLIVKSTDTQFWLSAFAGANAAKAEYNVDLTIVGPETEEDYEKQNEYIEQAVSEGADAIVFSAISYSENAAAIDAAARAGVKIIVIDSDVDSQNVSARIGTDNVQAGMMTGSAVLDTGDDEICVGIVNFAQGTRNGQEREEGLRGILEDDPRVKKIYMVNVASTPEAAELGAEELLNDHPDINVLVGLNEPLAVGTGRAVVDLGVSEEVRVVGFDTNLECVELMRDGAVSALIAQNPYAMGYLGVESAWKVLEGESFDPNTWIDTATTIITHDNMFSQESQQALFSFS